jgi:hypothetical protein
MKMQKKWIWNKKEKEALENNPAILTQEVPPVFPVFITILQFESGYYVTEQKAPTRQQIRLRSGS